MEIMSDLFIKGIDTTFQNPLCTAPFLTTTASCTSDTHYIKKI